ncbi:MAG: Flp pilus assembly complex ATPase component TadA, partial [Planctomycetes bacterium]|nr:Flp pilus assembly complex ATPase component TadA [Planctomycetota bacterium]
MGQKTPTSSQNRAIQREIAALAERGPEGVPQLVDQLIYTAVELRASDLHFEPTANELKVRLRLDGVMHDFCVLEGRLQPNIVARCKVMAGLLTYRTDLPQEGGAAGGKYGDNLGLRVSTFPTNHGERVAIRLFDPEAKRMRLEELGFAADVLRDLQTSL